MQQIKIPIEGKINVGTLPKYVQTGEILNIVQSELYLCVQLGKIEKLSPPEDRDSYNAFMIVEWSGQIKKTKTIYGTISPDFREVSSYIFV